MAAKLPLDLPGFLRTVEGGYVTREDFLKFVAGASTAKHGPPKSVEWPSSEGSLVPNHVCS